MIGWKKKKKKNELWKIEIIVPEGEWDWLIDRFVNRCIDREQWERDRQIDR